MTRPRLRRERRRRRSPPSPRALAAWAVALALGTVLAIAPGAGLASRASGPATAAGAGGGYLTGIGDESPAMFGNPLWQRLHTKIVRYIVPYDAVRHPYSLDQAKIWIGEAEARRQQVLVSFYHSEYSPFTIPKTSVYKRDVAKFIRLFPHVREYQAWDESNRGYIPHYLASPSAARTAMYYRALLHVCRGCTVVGLDVLDGENIYPTLNYIYQFKREIYRLHTVMPRIWGLHDYSDLNRLESWRTSDLIRALGGQVWLTETGGVVKFGGAFPNRHGSGLWRAARVLSYMFGVARSHPQIKRLYIYDWTGGNARTRFDAGLTNPRGRARPGYVVVCKHLHAGHCHVRIVRN
jgi:hypothetical protein